MIKRTRKLAMITLILALTWSGTACVSGRPTSDQPICDPPPAAVQTPGREFKTIIKLSPFGDGQFWYLQESLVFQPREAAPETVPRGFVTDFASIPAILWPVLPNWQRYGPGAIVHDYLYWSQHVSRATADLYLRQGMHRMRVPAWKREVIYWTLRGVGGFAWNSNSKKKANGMRKCMPSDQFPSSPRETWTEWQEAHPDGP